MDYYDGLNEKLLAAIPAATKVLEFGCAGGRLGQRYKELNPSVCWYGVDKHARALEGAASRLDGVWNIDIDGADLRMFGEGYDCVVIGDVLEHLSLPERTLSSLRQITTADARLAVCLPNMTHISIMERMLIGDLSYDENGLMDRTHLRFFSQASVFKLFLDSGWLPHLHSQYTVTHPNAALTSDLLACAKHLGVSQEAAERMLHAYQLIIACNRIEGLKNRTTVPLSVIVPVNNEAQFALNVMRSPGLAEVGAQILPLRDSATAAEAFIAGQKEARGEWLLFCHQDTYFPVGSGFSLSSVLAAVPSDQAERTIIGFAGVGTELPSDPYARTFNAGLVVDRINCYDWPKADKAVSLDEFAVVLHRSSPLAPDPTMGWHLWATDLCLASMYRSPAVFAQIVRVPVYHNSLSGHALPPTFHASAARLMAKYPDVRGIRTLCATIG